IGFSPDGLLSMAVEPSISDVTRWDQFFDTLLARVAQLPWVRSTGAVYLRPLTGPIGNDVVPVLEGQAGLSADAPWRSNPHANLETVTPGYFQTLGTRFIAGRDFTSDDRAQTANVVIVSASAARRYWPGRDPIAQRLVIPTQREPGSRDKPRWQTVVGVVEDIRYRGIRDPRLDVYMPARQSTAKVKFLMIRSDAPPGLVGAAVRDIAHDLDGAVQIGDITSMHDVVAQETGPWRFAMRLLIAFGVLAAAIATAGVSGLVSLAISLRLRELAIRSALGAGPGALRANVLREAAVPIATGTVVGVICMLIMGRLASSLLIET